MKRGKNTECKAPTFLDVGSNTALTCWKMPRSCWRYSWRHWRANAHYCCLSLSNFQLGFLFCVCVQDNVGELDTDRQDELRRARRLGEEEEERSRKSALLFGSEDTCDSIASLEEKVCGLWCIFMIHSCAAPGLTSCHNCSGV